MAALPTAYKDVHIVSSNQGASSIPAVRVLEACETSQLVMQGHPLVYAVIGTLSNQDVCQEKPPTMSSGVSSGDGMLQEFWRRP